MIEEDLNSRFEFENNHYKRSMNNIIKGARNIKSMKRIKVKKEYMIKTGDKDKERILKW